ncbi:MAG TPA: DUF4167 domain-containing protein [Phenylobacterium sp.]|nr:DUF4167 domain-containing protein [Phenylobacterium sp.]
MRDFKGMKRQRGRNRGGGGGGGGNKPTQNANRAFDSNGPEGVKVRGNAQHVFEKYQQLARDANAAGDRVLAENHLQHAEHYFRLLRAIQPNRPASEILGRDQFASGYDIDFEDESGQAQAAAADEAAEGGEGREDDGRDRDRNRDRGEWQSRDGRDRDRNRDDRPRDDRPRDDRPRDERPRDDRPRDDRPRDDRPREDRWRERDRSRSRDDRPRDDRPRDDRPRDERPRDDRPRAAEGEERRERFDRQDRGDRPERSERPDRPARDPLAVVQPQGEDLGREPRPAAMLRDAEGGESHAPAFLQQPAAPRPEAGDEDAPARRPRRRRAPRSFEGDAGQNNETEEA